MYQFLSKYGQTAAFGLGALISLLFFIQIFSGISTFEGLSKPDQLNTGIFSFGLYAAVALAIICAVAIVLFGIYYLVTHPKSALKSVVPFLVLVGIFIVSYIMAKPSTSETMLAVVERFQLTPGDEKFITAGLWTMLILFFGAAIAFAVSEVRNFFK